MKTQHRNMTFLIELLINVLVFSVSCAVLVGVFGKASGMARSTREKSSATSEIYSLFETVRAGGEATLADGTLLENGGIAYYYNDKWNPVQPDDADYTVVLTIEDSAKPAGTLRELHALATSAEGDEICELATHTYQPDEKGVPHET